MPAVRAGPARSRRRSVAGGTPVADVDQRVSLITLGVADIERAAAFYDALGWVRAPAADGVVAYDLIGGTLGLYPLARLAEDMGLDADVLGHGAMTLSCNVRTRADVSPALEAARAAGADVIRAASDIFRGGHVGCFRDPDGHVWEIAWNPHAPLGQDGAFRWNGY